MFFVYATFLSAMFISVIPVCCKEVGGIVRAWVL